jgi:hypothetical protein
MRILSTRWTEQSLASEKRPTSVKVRVGVIDSEQDRTIGQLVARR